MPLLMVSFKKCVHYYCMYNTFLQDGSTLVHLAAKSGQAEVATIFVEKGVPIQMPNKVKRITFILSKKKTMFTSVYVAPYLSVFSPNAGKYGPEILRMRTLFT